MLPSVIQKDVASKLISKVEKHDECSEAYLSFKSTMGVQEAMVVLSSGGNADIAVKLGTVDHRVFVCSGSDC